MKYCNAKCENIHCGKKITKLKQLSERGNEEIDMSEDCDKYIKSIDPIMDQFIENKVEDK